MSIELSSHFTVTLECSAAGIEPFVGTQELSMCDSGLEVDWLWFGNYSVGLPREALLLVLLVARAGVGNSGPLTSGMRTFRR